MPGIVMDKMEEEAAMQEKYGDSNSAPINENNVSNESPGSTMRPQCPVDLDSSAAPVDEVTVGENIVPGVVHTSIPAAVPAGEVAAERETVHGVVETSIEELYENVCDMQSSDMSPSRHSFGSEGEESRIDSELRHLVGGDMREVEIMEEEEEEVDKPGNDNQSNSSSRKGGSSESRSKSKKSGKLGNNPSARTDSVASSTSRKGSHSEVSSKLSPKSKIPPEKPSVDVQNHKNLKQANTGVKSTRKLRNSPLRGSKLQNGINDSSESGLENLDLGRFLLKQARDLISSGDKPQKALELALRAASSFESYAKGKPNLELVMSLHVVAAIYSSIGQYNEAIPVLERSIEIPEIEGGQENALAKFAGYMQLGDTFAMLGQLENSTKCYTAGLEVQKQILGESDPRVGETCRYLAEAYVQALQFDEAQRVCQMALDIHKECGSPASLEEAADRRLMGLICETKGDHEAALEHLVLASMAMVANGHEAEVAYIDCSIGDTYLSLSRYDEAVFAYQKVLTALKTSKGESHPAVGAVFIRLADLYNKTGKLRDSKSYCENALRIFEKPMPGIPPEDIASGLTDISAIYESMNDLEQAIKLLQKALKIYSDAPGQQHTIAGIEAQMGVMYYMMGNFFESYKAFKSAISKLRASGEKKSSFFGIALNQMGLACVQRYSISEAVELFEEAKSILEQECGPYHPDTLGVYSNLAGTYDAMGRLDDAIEILEHVVRTREQKLGTANPDVDDEKRRLAELLKEAGRSRSRKGLSLENLLGSNSRNANKDGITVL